jgi:hypothetical protein
MEKLDTDVLSALARSGILQNADGKLYRSADLPPDPDQDRRLAVTNEKRRRNQHTINARLERMWVKELHELIGDLVRDGSCSNWMVFSLFWIRLHGVLADLRKSTRETLAVFNVAPADWKVGRSELDRPVLVFRAIEAIRTTFSEDELIYADYRRQDEAHPVQSAYDVRWSEKKKEAVLTNRIVTLDDDRQHKTVDEMDAAKTAVLFAHGINEQAVAIAFARRMAARSEVLRQVMFDGYVL